MSSLKTLSKIDDETLMEMSSNVQFRNFNKDAIIHHAGQIENTINFLVRGTVRMFQKGKSKKDDHTIYVFFPGDFFSAYPSYINQKPSDVSLEAMNEVEIISVNRPVLEECYRKNHKIERAGKIVVEKFFVEFFNLCVILSTMAARDRYLWIINNKPEYDSIQLKHLASLIGIHPNSLSRLRKELKDKGKL